MAAVATAQAVKNLEEGMKVVWAGASWVVVARWVEGVRTKNGVRRRKYCRLRRLQDGYEEDRPVWSKALGEMRPKTNALVDCGPPKPHSQVEQQAQRPDLTKPIGRRRWLLDP